MDHPITIGIGGARSGSGKTTLASALLKYLTKKEHGAPPRPRLGKEGIRRSALSLVTRYSVLNKKWGAIKYTRTAFYASITDDRTILEQKGKDTKRLLDAGAEEALWIQSPPNKLADVLPVAMERLSHLDGIIIEGNSAIEFLKPDIVIFLKGSSDENLKPSAQNILKLADIIISDESPPLIPPLPRGGWGGRDPLPGERVGGRDLLPDIEELTNRIEMVIKKKNIEKLLRERSADNRITCGMARKIAEESGVSYKDVGKAANELKIKIKNCELGCF